MKPRSNSTFAVNYFGQRKIGFKKGAFMWKLQGWKINLYDSSCTFRTSLTKECTTVTTQNYLWAKASSKSFWQELMTAFIDMRYKQSFSESFLFSCWTRTGLFIWLTWIDDCLIANAAGVSLAKDYIKRRLQGDDVGELKVYVEFKV